MCQEITDVKRKKDPLTLIIDYGNGVQKRFANIPYEPAPKEQHVGVTDVLHRVQIMRPGLSYEFQASGYDRAGREVGVIVSVDGIDNKALEETWQVDVNQRSVPELRRVNVNSYSQVGIPSLEPGDVVTLRLVSGAQTGT